MVRRVRPSLEWLLAFVPAALLLHRLVPERPTLAFAAAGLAIVPLAGLMGKATEHLADRAGEGVGGLLNATFGNAAELIIALAALQRGLHGVVKASLTGSILGNILLVLGAAFAAGGWRRECQRFHASAARSQSTMLLLAAVALVVPAAYHHLGGREALLHEVGLSLEIALILLATYGAGLVFSLKTHRHYFSGSAAPGAHGRKREGAWGTGRALSVLAVSTAFVALLSEVLVASVEGAARALGMTEVFVGVIVVAVIGNAAEHSTAVLAALKDRMDLAVGIAVGSSIQVALFVAPVLVLVSFFLGPRPMDLVFTLPEVLAVVLTVLVGEQVTSDGESNWLEGVQLLSVYAILTVVFYLLPQTP